MISAKLIISIFLILTTAWLLGLVFSRFGLPAMLGELLAGVILGPPLLGIVASSPGLEMLAELGIFFVMFHTGMEMDPTGGFKADGVIIYFLIHIVCRFSGQACVLAMIGCFQIPPRRDFAPGYNRND